MVRSARRLPDGGAGPLPLDLKDSPRPHGNVAAFPSAAFGVQEVKVDSVVVRARRWGGDRRRQAFPADLPERHREHVLVGHQRRVHAARIIQSRFRGSRRFRVLRERQEHVLQHRSPRDVEFLDGDWETYLVQHSRKELHSVRQRLDRQEDELARLEQLVRFGAEEHQCHACDRGLVKVQALLHALAQLCHVVVDAGLQTGTPTVLAEVSRVLTRASPLDSDVADLARYLHEPRV